MIFDTSASVYAESIFDTLYNTADWLYDHGA